MSTPYLLAIILAVLALAASAMAAIKPYTKEKFFFAVVAVLFAYTVFFSGDKSKDAVQQETQRVKSTALGGQNQPPNFQVFVEDVVRGDTKPTVIDEPGGAVEVSIPTGDYTQRPGTKSVFRRQVELKPLGRVVLGGPSTPGINVLAGLTLLGPDLRSLPNRQPLGLLDNKAGQDLPPEHK